MQRSTVLVLWLFAIWSAPSRADAPIRQDPLHLAYSTDKALCDRIFTFYSKFTDCRLSDSQCFRRYWAMGTNGISWVLQHGWFNHFGYTSVDIIDLTSPMQGHAVVQLSDFQGDRLPYRNEVWKVDRAQLEELWKRPSGQGDKTKYSAEFQQLLSGGEKLSEAETAYVFEIDGKPFLFERECTGVWRYGGDYECRRVVGINVLNIDSDKKAAPVCKLRRTSGG